MLYRVIHLLIISFLLLTQLAWADQLIIEPEMGRKPIFDALNNSQHTIDLVMYGWTDEQLLNAFTQQSTRGKTVKVILEEKPYKREDQNEKTISVLKSNRIHFVGNVPPFRLIHQKSLILDDKKALVMTFNFTHSSFKNERNFALLIDDPKLVNEIATVFAADWNHRAVVPHSPDLIYSPDNSRDKLTSLIAAAKNTITIYAQDVNDYKLVGALAKAAKKGVQVNVLTSKNLREKQENYLTRAGVHIYYNKKIYIHAKVMIIDNKEAVIGSINFTRASLENNRELAVITRDSTVIKELNTQFQKDIQQNNYHSASKIYSRDNDRLLHEGIKLLKHVVNEFSKIN